MDHSITLRIEALGTRVESIEEFQASYYAREYAHAFQVLKNIISQGNSRKENARGGRAEGEVFNIIPFIGSRGTGKTTAMCSFANALEEYGSYLQIGKQDYYHGYLSYDEDSFYKCRFTCLEAVDGSLLEQGENIFNIILAQMYNRFLGLDKHGIEGNQYYGYEKRELQQSFDEVYRSMCKIENSGNSEEESYITSLINLSSSLSVKKSFRHLIEQFLKMVRTDKFEERGYQQDYEHFLVITIDDLDLNIGSGFEMLELLHRYMMVPRVIILIAIDYDQLQILCEKHFYKAIPQVDKILVQSKKDIDRLSQDFINKVLPFDTRIYMPSFIKYKDSFGGIVIQKGENKIDIKKAVFQEIYKKTGMRFDIAGKKKHFYEADNIREFVNLYSMIEDMPDLTDKNLEGDRWLELFRNNYSIFIADVRNRMANNRLYKQERMIFDRLKDETIDRSCRRWVNEIRELTKKKAVKALVQGIAKYGYSYGELLRSIYCVGRISFRKKELIRCLLAYLSIEMTRAYHQYRFSTDKALDGIVFKEILNGSFGGSWSNMIMPETARRDPEGFISDIVKTGAVCDVVMRDAFNFTIVVPNYGSMSTEEIQEKQDQWIRKVFKTVIVLGMFFSEQYHNNTERNQWAFEIHTEEVEREWVFDDPLTSQEQKNRRIEIRFKGNGRKNFNVLNFVSNAFEAEAIVDEIQNALYQALKEKNSGNEWISNRLAKEYNEKKSFDFLGINEEFRSWTKESYGFALPIYNLDLVYNLMKRIRLRRIWNKTDGATWEWKELWGYYEEVLNVIGDKLKENDNYYETMAAQKLEPLYQGFPFIQWVKGEENQKENLVKDFADLYADMVKNVVLVGKPETGEVETEIGNFED